jgi:hypothetical protein
VAECHEAGLIVATPVGQWIFVARNDQAIAAFVARVADDL